MSRIISMLFLLAFLFTACNTQRGPKQTLVFKAVVLPGSAPADALETTKRVIGGRLRSAKLKCRYQVKVSGLSGLEVVTYGADEAELDKIKEYVTANAALEFAPLAHPELDADVVAAAQDATGVVQIDGVLRAAWLTTGKQGTADLKGLNEQNLAVVREREVDGQPRQEWLIVHYDPKRRVTGNQLEFAGLAMDSAGKPAISFRLSAEGGNRMHELTSQLTPSGSKYRHLAIIWNEQIETAPRVQSAIRNHGQITGNFTQDEVSLKVALLQSGQLPCQITFEKVQREDQAMP